MRDDQTGLHWILVYLWVSKRGPRYDPELSDGLFMLYTIRFNDSFDVSLAALALPDSYFVSISMPWLAIMYPD